jgi:uncharacterized RDD family membrane protein YckC
VASLPPCSHCGQQVAAGAIACGFCGQVVSLLTGTVLTPSGRRLGQYLLDVLLAVVTLFIGWVIWSLVVWGDGQTPAMKILKMRVIKLSTSKSATWGTMFLREVVGKGVIMGVISAVFFPAWLILAFMLMWNKKRQELWDQIAGTIVVNDPEV